MTSCLHTRWSRRGKVTSKTAAKEQRKDGTMNGAGGSTGIKWGKTDPDKGAVFTKYYGKKK